MSRLYANQLTKTNQTLVSTFTFRHILENTDHYLIEVRDDSLFEGIVSPNFQWLKITKDFKQTSGLLLKSMDSSWDIEERFFEEGYLKFGLTGGIFIEKFNSGQHQYQLLNNEAESRFIPTLQNYFSEVAPLMN